MPDSIDGYFKAERAITQLIGANNELINAATKVNPELQAIVGLSPPARVTFDAAITHLGVDPAHLDTLIAQLQAVSSAIGTNLTPISNQI